ncbi:hypothetical protein NVP1184A_40 [Vibrio phage 1.184.A._10N.286.49.A5]|nr:hypothetical protein NVP1184A_40 [Vibrio phage 1.184.A._10N.286.49.A5]
MQNNAPLDKGRVAVVVEKYKTNQLDPQTNQPIMKNRYATVGRATLWPNKQGSNMPNVEIEIDTIPVGQSGPLKLYTFWDSENQNNQPPQQQGGYQQQQSGYQQHRG